MKLSRIFEPSNYYLAHGDVILHTYPHNKKAVELFSMMTFDNKEAHQEVVNQLLQSKEATLVTNEITIDFSIENRCLHIIYTFSSDLSVSDMVIYDSLFNNNDPETELFLAVTKSVCNAQLSKKSDQIILYSYPATAMYLNPDKKLPVKEKLRALLKRPFFLRFR
jgi:hypothetical protein